MALVTISFPIGAEGGRPSLRCELALPQLPLADVASLAQVVDLGRLLGIEERDLTIELARLQQQPRAHLGEIRPIGREPGARGDGHIAIPRISSTVFWPSVSARALPSC